VSRGGAHAPRGGPPPPAGPLLDGWGRRIESLRLSVTDRCNFRCTYCMPAEGLEWLRRDQVLSFEELARLVRVLAGLGVSQVRVTGGEPLVRRELPTLISALAATPGVHDLSLTTNGVMLDRLAAPLVAAGLRRINVSLDSLSHVRFAEITRRDALDRVLAGLEEAERHPELRPIKVNCVAVRGVTDEEIPAFAELARCRPYVVRFIEFMPLDADRAWRQDLVLTGAEIRARIEAVHGPLVEIPARAASTARRFRFADGRGEVGFVNAVSEPFCGSCDRIRLTADGHLRTCLFSRREWDLRAPLRDGASDAELVDLLREAVRHKELKHRVSDPGFVPASRSMSQIGG
jgi:cyclic pyranopterin phosphate synthase